MDTNTSGITKDNRPELKASQRLVEDREDFLAIRLRFKAHIKQLAQEGRSLRLKARKASGDSRRHPNGWYWEPSEKWKLQHEALQVGRAARHALLAYGFFRGKKYRAIEPHCREGNGPRVSIIKAELERCLGGRFTGTEDVRLRKILTAWVQDKPFKTKMSE